jgi:hypothetical protein
MLVDKVFNEKTLKSVSDMASSAYSGIDSLSDLINKKPNTDDTFYASRVIDKVGLGNSLLFTGLSKIPLDSFKNNSSAFSNAGGLISGGLYLASDIADMAQGKDKTLFDYLNTGTHMANTISNLPGVKNIPGIGGITGLAADGVKIAQMAVEKNKNPFYWTEVGLDALSNAVSFIPGLGQFLQPVGQSAAFIFHCLGQGFEDAKIQNQGEANRKHWEWEEIQKRQNDEIVKNRNDNIKREQEYMKEAPKSITYLEQSTLPRLLNQVNYSNTADFDKALRTYADLVQQGRMKDINLNDINWMKGQQVIDVNNDKNKMSLHDFLVNNPEGAIDAFHRGEFIIDTNFNPDYTKIRNETSQHQIRDLGAAEELKWIVGNEGALSGTDLQRARDNTVLSWDNSNEAIPIYQGGEIKHPEWIPNMEDFQYLALSGQY